MKPQLGRLLPSFVLFVCATSARAEEITTSTVAEVIPEGPSPRIMEEIFVHGVRPMTAASASTVRARDFLLRPRSRPADILAVAPGLVVAQHAGGGKANQYFMRGFDLDHGTDIALSIDGIPINLLSHGHGQGYSDLSFLIPEIIEKIEVTKGPYFAEQGDLATAGSVNLVTKTGFNESRATLEGGSFQTLRSLFVLSPGQVGEWTPMVAAEVYRSDGPFKNPENNRRYNAFAKMTRMLGDDAKLSLAFASYAGEWNASGQLPMREVLAGRIDRFGSVDPDEGGRSQRHSLYASYESSTDESRFNAMAYVVHHRWGLFSNFTFFSADPINGDMIEQTDDRTIAGLKTKYSFTGELGDMFTRTSFGVQLRADMIENGLYHAKARERLETLINASVGEASAGVFGESEMHWTSWMRTIVGARADWFGFDVDDHAGDNSGTRGTTMLSPKATLVITPVRSLDLYANFGLGFHSNDARGVVRRIEPVTPLTRATGSELGFRTKLFDRLDLAGAAFLLDLDSEIVWVGDEGTTEARGATRRVGLEGEARLAIFDWLFADVDATYSKSNYLEDAGAGTSLALAPKLTMSAGLSVRHPDGFYGRLSGVHIGDRPATEDEFLTAEGFTRFDATAGYRTDDFEVSVAVENLLNTKWSEVQFANTSRLPGETSAGDCPAGTRADGEGSEFAGCEDIHFAPGAPLNVQATLSYYF